MWTAVFSIWKQTTSTSLYWWGLKRIIIRTIAIVRDQRFCWFLPKNIGLVHRIIAVTLRCVGLGLHLSPGLSKHPWQPLWWNLGPPGIIATSSLVHNSFQRVWIFPFIQCEVTLINSIPSFWGSIGGIFTEYTCSDDQGTSSRRKSVCFNQWLLHLRFDSDMGTEQGIAMPYWSSRC